MGYSSVSFNGERSDPASGHYHLGNGYRIYNPELGRFTAPDSWSPFDVGGINPYTYCAGDPVNRTDPSGHISGMGIAGMVMGVLGILMTPFTGGQSLTVMSCLIAGLEVTSGATAIATGALEESSPQASSALGWISLGMGLLSLGAGLVRGVGELADGAAGLIGRFLRRVNGKIGIPMSGEFRNARFIGAYDGQARRIAYTYDDLIWYRGAEHPRRNIVIDGSGSRARYYEWDVQDRRYDVFMLSPGELAQRVADPAVREYRLVSNGLNSRFGRQFQAALTEQNGFPVRVGLPRSPPGRYERPLTDELLASPVLRNPGNGITTESGQAHLDRLVRYYTDTSYAAGFTSTGWSTIPHPRNVINPDTNLWLD